MHIKTIGSAACLLAATALAAPRPQSYDFADLLSDEPAVTEIVIPASATAATAILNPTSASEAVAAAATEIAQELKDQVVADGGISRRGTVNPNCATVTTGNGPVPNPDTFDAFVAANSGLLAGATDATPVPSGYTKVYTGALGQLPAYGWYALKTLPTYDVQACANYCSGFTACSSFNIFYEHLPQQDPVCNPDTPSVTQVKCVAHGWNPTSAAQATNKGQWRGKFQTATAGAAAYVQKYSTAPAIDGFTAPHTLADGKCAVNAPLDPDNVGVDGKNLDTYMGTKLFTNTPFDPSLCTKLCQDTTVANSKNIPKAANGLYKSCNYVNVFMINKNSAAQGMQCSMYSRDWKAEEDKLAVNCGYTDTRWNDKYTITRATSYAVSPSVARTDVAIKSTSQLLDFEKTSLSTSDTIAGDNGGELSYNFYNRVYGFVPYNIGRVGFAQSRVAGTYPWNSPRYPQPQTIGDRYGFCNYPSGCVLTAPDFTFDLVSLKYGSLVRAAGTYILKGYRNGAEVAVANFDLKQGQTVPEGATGPLGDAWKNLDAVSFYSPGFAGFDDLQIVKYPSTKKRSLEARQIDPVAAVAAIEASNGELTAVEYAEQLAANATQTA